MDHGLVGLAFAAGLVAALNPCGFAMLPAYLLLVVRGRVPCERPGVASVARALAATLGMALGFLTVFGLFGALTVSAASTAQRFLPYGTVVIGIVLMALGVWLLSGRELSALTPRRLNLRWAPTVRLSSMYSYGVSYAIASLSCTIAPFLAVTGAGLRAGSVVTGVSVYLAYVAGLTLVVGVLAMAAALASSVTADRLRRILPFVNRISGGLLLLVGLYVAYFAGYELRLFTMNASPRDAVIAAAGRLQGTLAGWVHQHGIWPWAAALLALAAVAGASAWRRRALGRREWLPDPAAPAAPQVADQEDQYHHGEADQKQILDMSDMVTAQHRQQEYEREHADAMPGAVIDPAPTPRCRRHLDGVDVPGETFHLGTGHGESLSERNKTATAKRFWHTRPGTRGPRRGDGPRRRRAAQ